MKKLLSILGSFTLITTGTTTLISCKTNSNENSNTDDNDKNQDLDILLKIMNEAMMSIQKYVNEKAIININDYQVPELNELFDQVNEQQPTADLSLDTNLGNKINNFFETSFLAFFNNLNQQIANEYSNYYQNSMPFTFKTSPSILKANYVDLSALEQLTSEEIKDLKAVVLNYTFSYTGTFKGLTSPTKFTIKYVITNNPDLIKNIMFDLSSKISAVLINFINQNSQIMIDQNTNFKKTYDAFNIYYEHDISVINDDMLIFLDNMFKNDATTSEIMKMLTYDTSQNIINLQLGTINYDNYINYKYPYSEMKKQTPAAWAGSGENPSNLTTENFVKFYRSKMKILKDETQDLMLGTFNINFSKIIIAGLPLLANSFNNGQPLTIQIKISQAGLTNKLTNFGNIIVAFIKYYNAKLAVSGTNQFYISQDLLDEIKKDYGNGYYNINLSTIYKKILQDFKATDVAKSLTDLELFTIQSFRSYDPVGNFTDNSFEITTKNGQWWSFGFYFGSVSNASLGYTAWVQNYQPLKFNVK